MLKKSFLVAAAVLVVACSENPEKEMLKFPVKEIADLPQAVALTPEKVPLDLMTPYLMSLDVFDGKLLTNVDFNNTDHCLDVYDVNSGEFLSGLCRRGRGPGEFTGVAPFFSVADGSVILYDSATGIASEVSLNKETFGDVTHRVRLEAKKEGFPPILASLYRASGEGMLGYSTIQTDPEHLAIDTPYFALYDWNSGVEKRAYELFDMAPVPNASEFARSTAFDLYDCMSGDGTTLCFVMGRMPVFAFLDVASGQAKGFRLKGEPVFSVNSKQDFFEGVCALDKYVFVLYGPDERNFKTTLYKLDWEGNLLKKYELDGCYRNCCAAPDKLYFIGAEDDRHNAFYKLDMADM